MTDERVRYLISSLSSSPLSSSITLSLQAQNLPFNKIEQILPTVETFFYLLDCLHDNGTGPITCIILFLVSHFNFLFVPCGALSRLPVISCRKKGSRTPCSYSHDWLANWVWRILQTYSYSSKSRSVTVIHNIVVVILYCLDVCLRRFIIVWVGWLW